VKSFQGNEERSLMNDGKIRIDFQVRCRWFSLSLVASQFYFYDFIWRNQIDKGNDCNRRLLFLSSQNCFYFNSLTNRTSSHLISCYALQNISAYLIRFGELLICVSLISRTSSLFLSGNSFVTNRFRSLESDRFFHSQFF